MRDPPTNQPEEIPLNPALKRTTETVYDTTNSSPPPIDTASANEGEGEGWPLIWLIVTVACIAVVIYLMS